MATTPNDPGSPRRLLALQGLCMFGCVAVGIIFTVSGVAISWPIWLLVFSTIFGFAGRVVATSRPRASQWLGFAQTLLLVVAVVGLVAVRR